MQVLIIEDEAPAARQLVAMLGQLRPAWQVVATLDSVTASAAWLSEHQAPDLIFMDIQLADGLSFSIFEQVPITSEVVFCTAFDQYAVEAFKRHAAHYLLKPVAVTDLEEACHRVEEKRALNAPAAANNPALLQDLLKQLAAPTSYKDRFLVKNGHQLAFLQTSQIGYFRSSGGLTEAWLAGGKRFIVDYTLDELEHQLDPKQFFRVSRQYYVALGSLQKIVPHLNGRLKLDLAPDAHEEVYVSRERVHDFKEWLGA